MEYALNIEPIAKIAAPHSRHWRRARGKSRTVCLLAALTATETLFLLQVLFHALVVPPEPPQHRRATLAQDSGVVVTQRVTLAPEPNAAVIVISGVAGLLYWRCRKKIEHSTGDGKSALHPSNTAIAAA